MFQRKKKDNLQIVLERMLDYNYDTKFAICNFLCNKKIKSRAMKRAPANKHFDTYFAW